ncbi:F-box/WD repeat-containing protein 4 isoform X2 [Hemitrygon akajei]|uniref:F-box/WD repeat-containing protein 4 isoform X2 n=1 Tax=Hemitrygon akajei TaxID=2704970 RepID=UPI003BF96387
MLALLLPQLPDDILLLLFSYTDTQALGRLSQVCRRFQRLIGRDTLWRSIAKLSLNTGLTRLGRDAFPQIALKERVKVSQNWKHGRCRQEVTLRWKCNLLPWLQLDKQWLYLSQASDIRAYPLSRNAIGLHRHPAAVYTGHQDDVCRFVVNEPHVVSGGGSVMTGTACCGHASPLRIWDLQSGQLETSLGSDFRRGAGVLDMVYESPSVVLTCGYDAYIRQWDVRASTRRCVMEWEEPHDSALYCLQTDGNFMIASGSSHYGVVRLWDKRQSKSLQMFFLSCPSSSPVYCLRFTTSHLYAALAYALYTLDFTSADSWLAK